MATFTLRLSRKKNELDHSEVMIRFRHGKIDLYSGSGVFLPVDKWDAEKEAVLIPNIRIMSPEKVMEKKYLEKSRDTIDYLKSIISSSFNEIDKEDIRKDWMLNIIDKYHHPEKHDPARMKHNADFFDVFDDYLIKRKLSHAREKDLKVLIGALKRFEGKHLKRSGLVFEKISAETLSTFEKFLRSEDITPKRNESDKKKEVKHRSRNTISSMFRRLRAFFNWCEKEDIITNNPFSKYEIIQEKYTTPYYLTLEERNHIADFDLSKHPTLSTQRDIFIFQCLIGCRVSDLLKMTNQSVIKNAIEYIPIKTKNEKPLTVRVPLNDRAKGLIEKYQDNKRDKLFPFISAQKYNNSIKEIFKLAGVNRSVTVLDPETGNGAQKPLHEVASSHLARRTFVGNLYKQVKDPNLVGSLSGHTEGSKAFARYRDIDEEMKKDLVKLIE